MTELNTNIKNLPEGEYFTEVGYSQMYPWKVVKRSPSGKTITLAKVEVKADPEWKEKMEFYPGGFCGHCANQSEQTWLFDGVSEEYTIQIRLVKNGGMWARKGVKFLENRATEFYDYNF